MWVEEGGCGLNFCFYVSKANERNVSLERFIGWHSTRWNVNKKIDFLKCVKIKKKLL